MSEQFSLSKSNQVYLLIASIGLGFFVAWKEGFSSFGIGSAVGTVLALMLLPSVIAWIIWKIGGKRGASLTFNIVLTLVVMGQVSQALSDIDKAATLNELRDDATAFKDEALAAEDTQAAVDAYDAYVDNLDNKLKRMSDQSTGKEKRLMQLISEFVKESHVKANTWQRAYMNAVNEATLDFSALDDSAAFKKRYADLDTYVKETKSYEAYFKESMDIMAAKLSPIGPESKLFKETMTGAQRKHDLQKPYFNQLIQEHYAYADSLEKILRHLENVKDHWSMEDGQLAFDNDADLETFNTELGKCIKIENEVQRLSNLLVQSVADF